MEKFWEIAVTTAGIGAVGAFVFFILYKRWLQLQIFHTLTSRQTFAIMLVFLGLVFLSLLSMLGTYVWIKTTPEQISSKLPADLKIVDISINDKERVPKLDIKVRNNSDEVVFVKRAEIEVLGQWDIPAPGNPSAVPVSAKYDIELSAQPGFIALYNISQEVKPNSADRFEFSVSSNHAPYPYLGIFAYLIKVKIVYNEDNRVVEAPPILLHIQTKVDIMGYFRPPPSRALIQRNKTTAQNLLKSVTADTIYQPGILESVKSWAKADVSQSPD